MIKSWDTVNLAATGNRICWHDDLPSDKQKVQSINVSFAHWWFIKFFPILIGNKKLLPNNCLEYCLLFRIHITTTFHKQTNGKCASAGVVSLFSIHWLGPTVQKMKEIVCQRFSLPFFVAYLLGYLAKLKQIIKSEDKGQFWTMCNEQLPGIRNMSSLWWSLFRLSFAAHRSHAECRSLCEYSRVYPACWLKEENPWTVRKWLFTFSLNLL